MIKKIFTGIVMIISLLTPPVFASDASVYYSDGPWSGRLIDKETKEPIEGAVVVAVWFKSYAGPAGNATNYFDASEAVTDKEGEFVIHKFKALNFTPIISFIQGPRFTIYKPGYPTFPGVGAQYFDKYFPENLKVDVDRQAELFKKGVVIELPKLKTWIERIESLELAYFYGHDKAPDRKLPNYNRTLMEEDNYLKPLYKYGRGRLNIPIGEIPK